MAIMTQEMKKALSIGIKKVLKKYNVKATISVRHHSCLCVNIKESEIDFCLGDREYITVSERWIEDNYTGTAKSFLLELGEAVNGCDEHQNFDKSDAMTDYFHVGWYTEINIGKWDKPYSLISNKAA